MPNTMVAFIKSVLGEAMGEVFELNQLLLAPEERMGEGTQPLCKVTQGSYGCSLAQHHNGQHIAHDLTGNIVHRWDW